MEKTTPSSVKLERATARKLRQRAATTGWSQAEIIRAAVDFVTSKTSDEVSEIVRNLKIKTRVSKKQLQAGATV